MFNAQKASENAPSYRNEIDNGPLTGEGASFRKKGDDLESYIQLHRLKDSSGGGSESKLSKNE